MLVGQHKRELSAFSDVALATLAYLALVRWHIGRLDSVSLWYLELIPVIVGVWWIFSAIIRREVSYRLGGLADEVRDTVGLNAAGGITLLALSLLTRHLAVSRLVLAGFPLLSCVLAMAVRLAARGAVGAWRRRGHDARHILLVGPADASLRFDPVLRRRDSGLRAVGLLLPPGTVAPGDYPLNVLGDYHQLAEVLHSRVVDQLVVTAPLDDPGLRPTVETAMREGKTLYLLLDAFGARLVGRGPEGLLVVLSPQPDAAGMALKRVIDIALGAVCLVLLAPVLLVCAAAIKLDDPGGPVIFRQARVGLHGRRFVCYKLRSMVRDAETRRQALLAHNEMDGPVFKIRGDPRVTRVGRFLRRYSLDELPQLWNVLRGDMSLVGPRPPLPDEVQQYAPDFRRRLAFRPGLTCLWQVSGRNSVNFHQWMELDLAYVDNWSIWLDLRILLRTIPTVLFGSGM